MAALYVVAAWLIMQVAGVLMDLADLPEWVGPVVLTLLAIGFPIALILSWIYELTPEGVNLEKDTVEAESSARVSGRRIDFVVIALLVAGLMLFAWDKWWTGPPPRKSIAVLAFENMSGDAEQQYFSDGISEEILNALAQLRELQVTARTSSFFFKGKNYPISRIADQLNVAYVVEGSVRQSGDTVRITAQLIRASDSSHIWSNTYDGSRSDVLGVQTDVAERIAAELGILLDEQARKQMRDARINDVQSFIKYQKGLESFTKAHNGPSLLEDLAIANAYFDEVLAVNPNLVAVRVLRADYANHSLRTIVEGDREEQYEGQAADLAEDLQKELEVAWRTSPAGNQRDILNVERTLVSDDWTGLAHLIEVAMRPGDCPRLNILENLEGLGYASELATKLEESLVCNPMDPNVIHLLARALVTSDRPAEALQLLDRVEGQGIDDTRFLGARFYAMLAAGRTDDPEMQSFWRYSLVWQVMHEVLQGNSPRARKMAEEYWARPEKNDLDSIRLALLIGDRERANQSAARIDSYPSGPLRLVGLLRTCLRRPEHLWGCRKQMPFDLAVTPNFRERLEESGISWPPLGVLASPTEAL